MTVEQFAYLKCPSKIRAAIINYGGPRLSVELIERRLSTLPKKVDGAHIGEPKESDGIDFRVAGLVKPRPQIVARKSLTEQDRQRIAELAKGVGDKQPPEKRKTFRYKAPPRTYGGTAYAAKLIDRVCEGLEIPRDAFASESRQKFLVAARALVVKLLRERNEALYSYPRLAEIIGRGDHSTTINLMQKFDHYCTLFPEVADLYLKLREGGE